MPRKVCRYWQCTCKEGLRAVPEPAAPFCRALLSAEHGWDGFTMQQDAAGEAKKTYLCDNH